MMSGESYLSVKHTLLTARLVALIGGSESSNLLLG